MRKTAIETLDFILPQPLPGSGVFDAALRRLKKQSHYFSMS
jgi:hypothetical protein